MSDLRDAARLLATLDSRTANTVLGEEHEYDDLFDRGLLVLKRDYCEEYVSEITERGLAFITAALTTKEEPHA